MLRSVSQGFRNGEKVWRDVHSVLSTSLLSTDIKFKVHNCTNLSAYVRVCMRVCGCVIVCVCMVCVCVYGVCVCVFVLRVMDFDFAVCA